MLQRSAACCSVAQPPNVGAACKRFAPRKLTNENKEQKTHPRTHRKPPQRAHTAQQNRRHRSEQSSRTAERAAQPHSAHCIALPTCLGARDDVVELSDLKINFALDHRRSRLHSSGRPRPYAMQCSECRRAPRARGWARRAGAVQPGASSGTRCRCKVCARMDSEDSARSARSAAPARMTACDELLQGARTPARGNQYSPCHRSSTTARRP